MKATDTGYDTLTLYKPASRIVYSQSRGWTTSTWLSQHYSSQLSTIVVEICISDFAQPILTYSLTRYLEYAMSPPNLPT